MSDEKDKVDEDVDRAEEVVPATKEAVDEPAGEDVEGGVNEDEYEVVEDETEAKPPQVGNELRVPKGIRRLVPYAMAVIVAFLAFQAGQWYESVLGPVRDKMDEYEALREKLRNRRDRHRDMPGSRVHSATGCELYPNEPVCEAAAAPEWT
jgi:hypothetical protein